MAPYGLPVQPAVGSWLAMARLAGDVFVARVFETGSAVRAVGKAGQQRWGQGWGLGWRAPACQLALLLLGCWLPVQQRS